MGLQLCPPLLFTPNTVLTVSAFGDPRGEPGGEESTWATPLRPGLCPLVLTPTALALMLDSWQRGASCKFVLKVGGLQSGLISKLLLRNGARSILYSLRPL